MSTPPEKVRIDKWLWAIRVYRTRTLATEACKAGHVKIGGKAVKPARFVVPGEVVTATVGPITRTVRAVVMLERRVGAKVLDQYIEDLTPAEEYQRLKERSVPPVFHRSKGKGRPTKRDRRAIDHFNSGPLFD